MKKISMGWVTPAKLVVAVLLLGAFAGCASLDCKEDYTSAPLIEMRYSTAGIVPVDTILLVSRNGHVLYRTPRQKRFCGNLDSRQLGKLRNLVSDSKLRESLQDLAVDTSERFEYEEVYIEIDDRSVSIPVGDANEELRMFLFEVGELVRKVVGKTPTWMRSDSLEELQNP